MEKIHIQKNKSLCWSSAQFNLINLDSNYSNFAAKSFCYHAVPNLPVLGKFISGTMKIVMDYIKKVLVATCECQTYSMALPMLQCVHHL